MTKRTLSKTIKSVPLETFLLNIFTFSFILLRRTQKWNSAVLIIEWNAVYRVSPLPWSGFAASLNWGAVWWSPEQCVVSAIQCNALQCVFSAMPAVCCQCSAVQFSAMPAGNIDKWCNIGPGATTCPAAPGNYCAAWIMSWSLHLKRHRGEYSNKWKSLSWRKVKHMKVVQYWTFNNVENRQNQPLEVKWKLNPSLSASHNYVVWSPVC